MPRKLLVVWTLIAFFCLSGAALAAQPGSSAPKAPAPKSAPSVPSQVDACEKHLFAIGGITASYIYTTFGYIGVTADAFGQGLYPKEQAQTLLREALSLLDLTKQNLTGLPDLNANDQFTINQMLDVIELLKEEATALSEYTATGGQTEFDRYNKARQEAWPLIKEVLGIK